MKKEIQPCTTPLCEVCKQIYDKKEENKDGVNSLQTLNPDGHIKCYCAKLNGPDDAVAVANVISETIFTKEEFIKNNKTIERLKNLVNKL